MDEDKKVKYPLTLSDGRKTEITLDNVWSEGLQRLFPGKEHEWLQSKFDRVCEKRPNISQIAQGNLLRSLVITELLNDLDRRGEL